MRLLAARTLSLSVRALRDAGTKRVPSMCPQTGDWRVRTCCSCSVLGTTVTVYRNQHCSKIIAFWDVAPCSLVGLDRRFRGAYCLNWRRQYAPLKTSVYIFECSNLHTHRRETLKSQTMSKFAYKKHFLWRYQSIFNDAVNGRMLNVSMVTSRHEYWRDYRCNREDVNAMESIKSGRKDEGRRTNTPRLCRGTWKLTDSITAFMRGPSKSVTKTANKSLENVAARLKKKLGQRSNKSKIHSRRS
jgi:hypothetical protein